MKDFSQPEILIVNRTRAHETTKLQETLLQTELTPHSILDISFPYLYTFKLTPENIHIEAIVYPAF